MANYAILKELNIKDRFYTHADFKDWNFIELGVLFTG